MTEILVVDDDADVADLLVTILESRGYPCRLARDGYKALHLLHEKLPDVVVLDVEMPQLSGPGTAYRMFVEDSGLEHVPIVLVSGVVNLSGVARQVGTPYFLAKPFDVPALLRMIERVEAERIPPTPTLEAS